MSDTLKDVLSYQVGGTHYKNLPIEHLELCLRDNISYGIGAAMKYLMRTGKKGDQGAQDLDKAIHIILAVRAAMYPEAQASPFGLIETLTEEKCATPELTKPNEHFYYVQHEYAKGWCPLLMSKDCEELEVTATPEVAFITLLNKYKPLDIKKGIVLGRKDEKGNIIPVARYTGEHTDEWQLFYEK